MQLIHPQFCPIEFYATLATRVLGLGQREYDPILLPQLHISKGTMFVPSRQSAKQELHCLCLKVSE